MYVLVLTCMHPCTSLALTLQDQPDKAVAELQQVVTRTKKRQKTTKDAAKAAAAAAAQTAGAAQQQQQQQPPEKGASQATGTQQQQQQQTPQGVKSAAARRASPAPPAEATAQTDGRRGSQDSETATEGGGGTDQDAARAGEVGNAAAAPADAGTQQTKVEFSQWGGGCVSGFCVSALVGQSFLLRAVFFGAALMEQNCYHHAEIVLSLSQSWNQSRGVA